MSKKRLLPHTIIPKDLYVLRDADRQLRQVIIEMGRPGYVLVARQMGKTNLLLNAKRELETKADLFIYIDLSRHFDSDRECFRTMIDTALDTYPDRLAEVSSAIHRERKEKELLPYKEHENELRSIIRAITGKLVIVLDEIDSLTNASFSDRIFAQVRSIYFSRTNYTEFERLTYVLSGVVEPNDIIKDKKISPFNIGQKIYLDDFTGEEFDEFLKTSGLAIPQEIKKRIFSWTNGNPRMTWDLCSAVEDMILSETSATAASVDTCVKQLYLDHFNRAPVDHIRELVAEDKDIRSAVEELQAGNGQHLSDALRSKLYLAGIIGPSASGQAVNIKNRIIEQALSKQWLRDIAIQRQGLLNLAAEVYQQGRYKDALELYEQYLSAASFSPKTAPYAYTQMGHCAYRLARYPAALEFFSRAEVDSKAELNLYLEKRYMMGLCHFQQQQFSESISCFSSVIESQVKSAVHVKSLLNVAAALMQEDIVKHSQAALDNLTKVIGLAEDASVELTDEDRTQLLGVAHYNAGRMWEAAGNRDETRKSFAAAATRCAPKDRPAILLAHYMASDEEKEKDRVLDEFAGAILSGEGCSRIQSPENPLVISAEEFMLVLGELMSRSKTEMFEKLVEFLPQRIAELPKTRLDMVFAIGFAALQNRNINVARVLFQDYEANAEGSLSENSKLLTAVRYLALFAPPAQAVRYQNQVFEFLRARKMPGPLESLDLQVIVVLLHRLSKDRAYSKMESIMAFAKSCRAATPSELQSDFAVIYYYEMQANEQLGFTDRVLIAARAVLALIQSQGTAVTKSSILRSVDFDAIKTIAENHIAAYGSRGVTIRKTPEIGPNKWVTVKYLNGDIKKVKFKKIKEELRQELCVLVD